MYAAKPFRYRLPAVSVGTPPRRKSGRRPLPSLNEEQLKLLRIDQLREALRLNAISFPSQVPVFNRHDRPDLQWKFAQLYYVLGWSSADIAIRYGIVTQRAGQVLNAWTRRAVELGYIQVIPPVEPVAAQPAIMAESIFPPAAFPIMAVSPVISNPVATP